MFNPPIQRVQKGQPVEASLENEIIDRLLKSIVVGPGLTMTRQGGQIVIALAENVGQIVPRV